MEERRQDDKRITQLCIDVAVIKTTLNNVDKRINGSIDDFERHISHGVKWRIAITVVAIGLVASCLVGAVSYGEMRQSIKDNVEEIKELRK